MARSVLLVGCGNMGHAMLKGWLDTGALSPGDVIVVEPAETLRARASDAGVETHATPDSVPRNADLVLFAVKPQVMASVVPAYRRFTDAGAAVASVAAGTRVALFEQLLGERVPVIRIMPNTPAAIGKGMMVTFANANAGADIRSFVDRLMAASGEVTSIDNEDLMDAVTAVSGSGPAYVFLFIECLTEAAVAAGLPRETAALLAMQTVHGAACLAKESAEAPARLREQVTSPNGTTAAALGVLMGERRLERLVTDAVDAARRRGMELGAPS